MTNQLHWGLFFVALNVGAVGCGGVSDPMPATEQILVETDTALDGESEVTRLQVRLAGRPESARTALLLVDETVVARLRFTPADFDRPQRVDLAFEGRAGGAVQVRFDPDGDGAKLPPGVRGPGPGGGRHSPDPDGAEPTTGGPIPAPTPRSRIGL